MRVADARMAGAIRLVSIERGHDPAKFVAMPFGGGGALHVGALIREIGLKCALVPRFPGITSALGCVLADLRHDMVQTVNLMLDGPATRPRWRCRMAAAGREASAVIAAAGIPVERIDVIYELDMHYLGQTHTVAVPLPVAADARGLSEALVRKAFETAYSASFSRLLPGLAVRIVSLRVAAIGRRPASISRCSRRTPSASLDEASDGIAQGVVRRRLARHQRLVAARAAGGRDDRGAGDPGAARRHHGDRARPCRPRRSRSAT